MKRISHVAAALLGLAAPALAGGPTVVADTPVYPPMPEAEARPDWTGPYGGLSLGRTSGDLSYQNPDFAYDVNSGSLRSVYLGYRLQQGDLVYGGEMELANLSGTTVPGFAEEYAKAFDVKGSVGLTKGKVLTYGVLGWSQVTYNHTSGPDNFGGISYGAGVEYAVTDRLGLGVEYLAREVDGVSPNGSPQTTDIGLDSLSLRIGLSF